MKVEELKCPAMATRTPPFAFQRWALEHDLDEEGEYVHRKGTVDGQRSVAGSVLATPGAKTVECAPDSDRGRMLDIGCARFDESCCMRPGLGTVRTTAACRRI